MSDTRSGRADPSALLLLTRALHLPATTQVAIGVKLRRLICLACKLTLYRQEVGLECLLRNCKLVGAVQQRGPSPPHTHVGYVHVWDEVQARFKSMSAGIYRDSKQGITTQTLVQRGVVALAVCDVGGDSRRYLWREDWLCAPVQVQSSSASGIYLGILQVMPKCFLFGDVEQLA